MNRKRYIQLRVIVTLFVGVIVALAVVRGSYLLAAAGVLTGMVFMGLIRSKAKIRTDERELTIGIAAFLLLLPSKMDINIFSKGEWLFAESLGMVFAYLTMFLIAIYAISYHFFNRKYGGGGNEE
ncbi:hypothetical protein HGB07_05960 [Candidatus Roizmanbacteria bacterium]|nr:hypothetical protein [Candidatus Roizmanbacteria bacterium]